ncbi:MAG: tetratricopeptide repeat protein [Gemmatimonas sp.]
MIDSGTLQGQDLAGAYASRGFARTLKRDLAGAESDLDQAIKIAPDDAQAYVDRANFWNVSRKADRAMADAEQAVRLDPHFPLAYFVRLAEFSQRCMGYM